MGEVRFYHLTQTPLEHTLPGLLEKSLERGWRVLVQGAVEARIGFLDTHLWAARDDSFLPHGVAGQGSEAEQPILLTTADDAPNNANVLMLIDGAQASPARMAGFELVALFFDGNDTDAVQQARTDWKAVTDAGLDAVYWAQEDAGNWVKKASSNG